MELFRRALNPWSQEVLIGVSWTLLYVAVVAGAAFVIGHAVYAAFIAKKEVPPTEEEVQRAAPGAPEQVERHTLVSRISHWILAVAVLTLLVTGFVPILGLKFPWVTIHWIAGLALAVYTVFHTVHAVSKRSLGSMWISFKELGEMWDRLKLVTGKDGPEPPKPGKWATENKAFHHLTMFAGLAVVATGLLMMLRVDTIFAPANPYILSDSAWGMMFVLHGLASVVFVGAIMVHIYFALHPEKHWITWSMIRGWISRRDYAWHHNPSRWPVAPKSVPLKGVKQRETPTPSATGGES
ncbi:MAG: cytochrome b/b6 domain-containing protein [Gemmatimonas sp.]|nr:cytochrome b/b6 domain-containing protein [Gemmatimonas sp.]